MVTEYSKEGEPQSDDERVEMDFARLENLNMLGNYCYSLLTEVQVVEALTKALEESIAADVPLQQVKKNVEEILAKLEDTGFMKTLE